MLSMASSCLSARPDPPQDADDDGGRHRHPHRPDHSIQRTLRPRGAPGEPGRRTHRHREQEEVYLVLEGTLTLLIEGEEQVLERGELIRVAPELRRQVVNRGPDRLMLIALGGAGEHQGRDGLAYPEWESSEEDARPPQETPMPPDLEV